MENERASTKASARERFLEAIVQSAIDYGIISMDLDGLVTSWNEGAHRILGWAPDEVLGRPVSLIFTPEDRESGVPQQEMAAAIVTGQGTDERWHLKKDGSQFWASGEMMPLKDENDELVGMVKILRDRTEQREQAETQRLLMHELGHRIKNTLSVVQAIATQSLRNAATLEEAANTLQSRISAYSKAHDLLLRKDWVGASLANIVAGAISNIGYENSGRVMTTGPDVKLGPQAALSFSLVLHELMTNAAKYGALSNDDGIIEIEWRVERIGGAKCLVASWREVGGPPVRQPTKTGFGSKLITSSLQAFGEVTLAYPPSGLVLEMTMPLSKLQFGDGDAEPQ
ncbi:PAS domain S-box protein [Pararhizobium sp. BT-229]|uniref:sensor histidine kinase n=1 Tax=Pararhizobium sp. BT-229 TaxID=2986923 RepID=UPI0021F7EAE8|nr:HWE histidine kinase domain-containing protein [Pararhizobium sp. BT-229]MCV9966823.1 PAS domain S-box protein [Pararhizobium sp. BT-229]